jgi:amino acid transporter
MIGVGASIGVGVFVLLGQAAAMAGPSVILGLILSGIVNMLSILSFCELGAALPEVGGEHVYVRRAFGGLLGFITGWFEWMSEMFYAVLMAMGAAIMISSTVYPYLPFIADHVHLLAASLVILFTLVNIKGTKETGKTAVLLATVLLITLAVYVASGWLSGFRSNVLDPFMPYGPLATMKATVFLFVVYLGAEDIVIAQGEVREPGKNIPRAIILNTMILIFVYTIIAYTTIGLVPCEELGAAPMPLALAAQKTFLGQAGWLLIAFAGTAAALSSLNTAIMAQSRAIYSMSWEGYMPRFLAKIHKRFKTPYTAVLFVSFFTLLLTLLGALEFAAYASSFGFLIGYFLTNLALIRLRTKEPYLERPFKVPFYPFSPITGIITIAVLIFFIDPIVLVLGAELALLALLVYYVSMMGYERIRIAVSGISMAAGFLSIFGTFLIHTGFLQLPFLLFIPIQILSYGLAVLGAVLLFIGVVNFARAS